VPGAAPDDYPAAMRQAGMAEAVADGSWTPGFDPAGGASAAGTPFDAGGGKSGFAMHGYGAVFVEVTVDPDLGLVRMRRCVGGYSAGRIINPKTARSQMTGGIIWGYGQAVLEESGMDRTLGRYLSKNLAGVMLPVNADIPDIDAFFVDEYDPHASLIGARGIGELGAVGVAPAIVNAVYHATGKRVRDLPIRIDRLLDRS
jgi:xanthine dehydrogenase YagR molybdenum-binding subunit